MKTLLENQNLIVRHDCFAANLIADCRHGIARLPWNARNMLDKIKTDSFQAFEVSILEIGGEIKKGGNL